MYSWKSDEQRYLYNQSTDRAYSNSEKIPIQSIPDDEKLIDDIMQASILSVTDLSSKILFPRLAKKKIFLPLLKMLKINWRNSQKSSKSTR